MNKTVKLVEGIEKANKSYSYLLPLLCKELNVPSLLNLVGIFLKHEDYPELDNHIFCLFRWSPNRIHTKFEEDLMKHPMCVFHKDVSSEHYLICFSVPTELQYSYSVFKRSKYSKISKESKEQILKFYNLGKDHAVAMVLNQDPRLKKKYEEALGTRLDDDAELSSVLDLDGIETYKSSYILESKSPLPKR